MTFTVGDFVTVRDAWPPGHLRTPAYVRGRTGAVVAVLGLYPNPEELAFHRSGLPAPMLYRIRFAQHELWPDYAGVAADSVDVEVYEHWLEEREGCVE